MVSNGSRVDDCGYVPESLFGDCFQCRIACLITSIDGMLFVRVTVQADPECSIGAAMIAYGQLLVECSNARDSCQEILRRRLSE